jgi:large subunit ribosomal protein L5
MEENGMRRITVAKLTLNMGVGQSGEELKMAQSILETVSGAKSVQTKAKIKQPKWDIRPGLPIGAKVTLRGNKAREFLKRALKAKDNALKDSSFDNRGNFGFGIKEYIDLPGTKYDPKLGIRGLDVLVELERKGYRVKRRKICPGQISRRHWVSKSDAIAFMEKEFGVNVEK